MLFHKINKTSLTISLCFVAFPLLIGLLNYIILAPETIVAEAFTQIFKTEFSFQTSNKFSVLCRNYLSDICWSVSLINALTLIIGTKRIQIVVSLIIATFFCIFIELAQLLGIIKGTFDYWDIILETLSIIITLHLTTKIRRFKNEKTT